MPEANSEISPTGPWRTKKVGCVVDLPKLIRRKVGSEISKNSAEEKI
jgi:hypothetical protein